MLVFLKSLVTYVPVRTNGYEMLVVLNILRTVMIAIELIIQ